MSCAAIVPLGNDPQSKSVLNEHNDEGHLAELLVASEALDEDVGKLLGKCKPRSKRGLIATALCSTSLEHGMSQRLLIDAGLTGTALAHVGFSSRR